uniref:Uncharacterized protein n=1 Tax=Anguilla anguilla TaxID=7936 RepID=A0A0E9XPG4_ANGAN
MPRTSILTFNTSNATLSVGTAHRTKQLEINFRHRHGHVLKKNFFNRKVSNRKVFKRKYCTASILQLPWLQS